MGLLQWCQLRPQGPSSDIAAVLFPDPVQVSSIRVFPTGAQPFDQSPGTIAVTVPEAFFLDVFFNALPVNTASSNQDAKDKRPKNVLVPTRIAYAGGQTEFTVDMGPEHATRLIIFQGRFQEISLAIYGEVVLERPETDDYESRPLPIHSSLPLSPSLDLANAANPTSLVRQLLSLMPAPAPLALVIRLMFCLKPEKEDWDNPEFPYVYSDMDKRADDDDIEHEVFDLESLVQSVGKPLRDDVSVDSLTEFAGRMRDLLGSDAQGLQVSDDAYYIAKLLAKSASQQISFSKVLLQHLELTHVFNEQTLDETTILCLLEAVANIEIARYFSEDPGFLQSLENMQSSPKSEKSIQKALKRLLARISGWRTFEDALTNPNGDFTAGAAFLKDISTDESALGCWLECMLNHESLVTKLEGCPVPQNRYLPPLLFQEQHLEVSHDTFIMFVRALLGMSTVLAILAWSDSLGDDPCCERTLNILLVWQGVSGYREILNHCLLLRQMTRRLEWIKNDADEQRPKRAGILVEQLLVGLAKDPHAMLRNDLVTTVLALKPPFCFITTDEMLEMDKLARVVQDGLLSAVDELAFDSVRPFSLRRLRVLRVSIAIVSEELSYDDGDWHVLEAFWSERSLGLIPRAISVLVDISDDMNRHFPIKSPPRMHQPLSELLFRTAADFLHLITHFAETNPLNTHDLRILTGAIADLYVCADAAGEVFSQISMAYIAAESMRQTCSKTLSDLSRPSVRAEPDALGAQVVMRTLFEHASKHAGRDPVHHVLQIHTLIDSILPRHISTDDAAYWATTIFPKVLNELKAFCRLLDPETQLLFIERLVEVDNWEIGIGEWLFAEELDDLSMTLGTLSNTNQDHDYGLALRHQIFSKLKLCELLLSSPTTSAWAIASLSSNTDISQSLSQCLSFIMDLSVSSPLITRLGRVLAKHINDFGPDLRFSILLLVLRNARIDPSAANALDSVPSTLKSLPLDAVVVIPLRNEIGALMSAYSDQPSTMTSGASEVLLQILEWLASQGDIKLTTIAGLSVEGFDRLCATLTALLPPARQDTLTSIRSKLSIDEDELLQPAVIELPETISLPLQSIENLLSSRIAEPSTPKGTKTPDILGVVISPPTALLRSPAATGLTKTYMNNDFRQLRQASSTRLNTSRMPSTHVDEFQHPSVPMDLLPAIEPTNF